MATILQGTYIFLIIHILLLSKILTDHYTAQVDIKKLLETEKQLPNIIKSYLKDDRERLHKLTKLVEKLRNSDFYNIKDVDSFLDNPVNIYHLFQWLNKDVRELINLMDFPHIKVLQSKEKQLSFPDSNDVIGIIDGLNRLIDVYDLKVSNLEKGKIIPGMKSLKELTAGDCLEIGQELFQKQKFKNAIMWLEEAKIRQINETKQTVDKESLFEFLSYSYYAMGYTAKAIEVIDEYMAFDLPSEQLLKNYHYYKVEFQVAHRGEIKPKEKDRSSGLFELKYPQAWNLYKNLCKNKQSILSSVESGLKCYFSKRNSPYLTIQPVKVEDVHHQPWIAIFHDIISDKEIEIIKNMTIPKLQRATSANIVGVESFVDNTISKSSWVKDQDHFVIHRISSRLQEITGLNVLESSESLQVVNYGIGGHYEPHLDYNQEQEETTSVLNSNLDNRLATILIYLSDVPVGGATIFPQLVVRIYPKKGSAAFWYNLFKTGDGNELTEHAACPVISGDKWVANKWIHSINQEFRRPCGLEESDYFDTSPLQKKSFK